MDAFLFIWDVLFLFFFLSYLFSHSFGSFHLSRRLFLIIYIYIFYISLYLWATMKIHKENWIASARVSFVFCFYYDTDSFSYARGLSHLLQTFISSFSLLFLIYLLFFLRYSSFIHSFLSSIFLIYFLFPFFVIPIYLHLRTFATVKNK